MTKLNNISGYQTIYEGHLYARPILGTDDPTISTPQQVLFLARVSYCDADELAQNINNAARQAIKIPKEEALKRGSLISALSSAPHTLVAELAKNTSYCHKIIAPIINASPESAAAPVTCLHVLSGTAPGSLCEAAKKYNARFIEETIRTPELKEAGYGFEWCANVAIQSGRLPARWKIVSMYEHSPYEEQEKLALKKKVDRQIDRIYSSVSSASFLQKLPDYTLAFRERFLTDIVEYLK